MHLAKKAADNRLKSIIDCRKAHRLLRASSGTAPWSREFPEWCLLCCPYNSHAFPIHGHRFGAIDPLGAFGSSNHYFLSRFILFFTKPSITLLNHYFFYLTSDFDAHDNTDLLLCCLICCKDLIFMYTTIQKSCYFV